MTNDSIMSGATSDQQESYSSFLGDGSDSRAHGSDEEMLEKQDAACKRERERVCCGEKKNQRSAANSRLDDSADCMSLRSQSQSSAMASMLSMPSGPAPRYKTGSFWCLSFGKMLIKLIMCRRNQVMFDIIISLLLQRAWTLALTLTLDSGESVKIRRPSAEEWASGHGVAQAKVASHRPGNDSYESAPIAAEKTLDRPRGRYEVGGGGSMNRPVQIAGTKCVLLRPFVPSLLLHSGCSRSRLPFLRCLGAPHATSCDTVINADLCCNGKQAAELREGRQRRSLQ